MKYTCCFEEGKEGIGSSKAHCEELWGEEHGGGEEPQGKEVVPLCVGGGWGLDGWVWVLDGLWVCM